MLKKAAGSPTAPKFSPLDAVNIFRSLDSEGTGQIPTSEFIRNLKASPELAAKLGMPEKLRRETILRESYQLVFGSFECDQAKIINVKHLKLYHFSF